MIFSWSPAKQEAAGQVERKRKSAPGRRTGDDKGLEGWGLPSFRKEAVWGSSGGGEREVGGRLLALDLI